MSQHRVDDPERMDGKPARRKLPAQIALAARRVIHKRLVHKPAALGPIVDLAGRAEIGLIAHVDQKIGLVIRRRSEIRQQLSIQPAGLARQRHGLRRWAILRA